jgi:hypothetical protein
MLDTFDEMMELAEQRREISVERRAPQMGCGQRGAA